MTKKVSLEVAIEVVLRNGPTFETIAGLCMMAADAEREKVAQWMIRFGFATGHGDTTEELLEEFEWQIRESEREVCAKALLKAADTWPKRDPLDTQTWLRNLAEELK